MPDYSKCLIYKLCCKDLDVKDIYVGSTCNFTRRKNKHKTDSSNLNSKVYNRKVYKFIRENGGFQNWNMIMIEEYPCENKLQKVKRERYWYEELKATLNSEVPIRDIKEYRRDNREKIKEKVKEYRKNNSDKNKEYMRKYREANKDAINQKRKEYREKNKEHMKEYYEANKEKINQKQREYRARKKNELLLKAIE